MGRTVPTYEIFIDWDNDAGLDVGNFELGTDGWDIDPLDGTIATSSTRAHLGDQCMLVTWINVANPETFKVISGLTSGTVYTLSAWCYVPAGDAAVRLGVTGVTNGGATTVNDAFQLITCTFTATGPTHTVTVNVNGTPANGDLAWVDQIMVISPGEDVSARCLGISTPLGFRYGRDQARSISAIQPGETSLELNNRSMDYSPDNASSPLFGKVNPGRPLLIRATFLTKSYDLFRGFIDDFTIDPSVEKRSITVSATDILGKLADAKVSTLMYPAVQTGQGIGYVLDAIGWPADKRDLDQGATTVRWWWEEGTTGLEAIKKLTDSEGPPAFAFVSSAGNFVFRDRHHRLRLTASKTSQATFRSEYGTEPVYSPPFGYDIGWRDLVNDIQVDVDEREPTFKQKVWTSEDVFTIATGQTYTIPVKTDEPFTNAYLPSATDADPDYEVLNGSVTVAMTKFSGQTTDINITASSTATVRGMAIKATPVPVARQFHVSIQEQASIDEHGIHSLDDLSLPWCGRNDAEAIAAIILGLRSERLPIVTVTLINANDIRTTHILQRDLSDRIHIVEPQTSLDHDFYIEKIEHDIAEVGEAHRASFGCEKIPTQPANVFTFDTAGQGFDQGRFGEDGIADSSNLLILGTSLIGTGLLGY